MIIYNCISRFLLFCNSFPLKPVSLQFCNSPFSLPQQMERMLNYRGIINHIRQSIGTYHPIWFSIDKCFKNEWVENVQFLEIRCLHWVFKFGFCVRVLVCIFCGLFMKNFVAMLFRYLVQAEIFPFNFYLLLPSTIVTMHRSCLRKFLNHSLGHIRSYHH